MSQVRGLTKMVNDYAWAYDVFSFVFECFYAFEDTIVVLDRVALVFEFFWFESL